MIFRTYDPPDPSALLVRWRSKERRSWERRCGAPWGIRTLDLEIRSLLLYPAELMAREATGQIIAIRPPARIPAAPRTTWRGGEELRPSYPPRPSVPASSGTSIATCSSAFPACGHPGESRGNRTLSACSRRICVTLNASYLHACVIAALASSKGVGNGF